MKYIDNYVYKYEEYPKWIKKLDNTQIIVNNIEEEKEHINEPVNNNSTQLNKKIINVSRSNRAR